MLSAMRQEGESVKVPTPQTPKPVLLPPPSGRVSRQSQRLLHSSQVASCCLRSAHRPGPHSSLCLPALVLSLAWDLRVLLITVCLLGLATWSGMRSALLSLTH